MERLEKAQEKLSETWHLTFSTASLLLQPSQNAEIQPELLLFVSEQVGACLLQWCFLGCFGFLIYFCECQGDHCSFCFISWAALIRWTQKIPALSPLPSVIPGAGSALHLAFGRKSGLLYSLSQI